MVLSHFKVSFREKTCIYKMDTYRQREQNVSPDNADGGSEPEMK